MNHIYKVIWNKTLNVWQAVSECAANNGKANKASQGKGFLPKLAAGSLLVLTLPTVALTAFAQNLPTGGQVQAGVGQINSNGQTMIINQASQNMVVDWQSFSIGKDASVNFVQPNAQSAALNRVLGDQVSNIRGALNANGQVFLVNPNGILFSPTARVDVGSLVSSTLNISNENFMNGNYRFEGGSSNAVINQGNIQTLNGGTVALIAAKIINTGSITTPQGNTLMGAGNKVVLDLGGPVKIEVEASELETYIEQGGAIKADGGTVYLTAKAANALTSSVINHTGITQAQTLASGEDGTIMLMGDMDSGLVQVAGTLDASAPIIGKGGFVETSAANVQINDVKVTTLAKQGKTGTWLIDPTDFTVSEGTATQTTSGIGATTLSTSLASTSVTLETQAADTGTEKGDIHINGAVNWNAATTLTLKAHNDIYINKAITANNTAGKLALEYGQKAVADGNTADYYVNAPVNLKAGDNFITKLGSDAGAGTTWTVVTDATAMHAISKTGNSVLGADLTLSGTDNWSPIGTSSDGFTGKFDGLGHTISNLNIAATEINYIGLFGYIDTATIQNIAVVDADVSGQVFVGILAGQASSSIIKNSYTTGKVISNSSGGGLVGTNAGTIENSYSSAVVNGEYYLGGLVGQNFGSISSSYAIGKVTGTDSTGGIGGLVGVNESIEGTASISNSYATGEVIGVSNVGGLVGMNSAMSMGGGAATATNITNSYATGAVSGTSNVGGLVGMNSAMSMGGGAATATNITNSYATGAVSGTNNVGGLVGSNSDGTITNSFFDKDTTNQTYGVGNVPYPAGVTGKTTAEMQDKSTYVGWNITEDSSLTSDYLYPVLVTENGVTSWKIALAGIAVSYTLSDITSGYTYNGEFQLPSDWKSSTIFSGEYTSWTLGTDYKLVYNSSEVNGFKNAGSYENISIKVLKEGFVASASSTKGKFVIAQKEVGLSTSKVYDGNVNFESGFTVKADDILSGDTVTVASGALTTASKNVGNYTNFATNTLALSNPNYKVGTTTAEITKKALTISGITASNKTYDGTTSATVNSQELSKNGLISDDILTVSATGTFANKNAETGKIVNLTATYGGADVGNYEITDQATTTADISKKDITSITGITAEDKTYDGNTDATLVTTDAIFAGMIAEDKLSIASATGEFSIKNVGNIKTVNIKDITLGGDDAGNYNLTNTSASTIANITKKALSVIGITAQDKVYDGTTDVIITTGTTSLVGLVVGDTVIGDFTSVTGAFTDKNAGKDKVITINGVSLSGTDANNYEVSSADATAEITKKALTISGITASDKTYDGTTSATVDSENVVKSGLIDGDNLTLATLSGTFANKNAEARKTVNLTATYGGLDVGNYEITDQATTTTNINKKDITAVNGITAENKTYDGNIEATLVTTAATFAGMIDNDVLTVATATGAFDNKNAGENKIVEITNLALGGTDAENYNLTSTTASTTANISAAPTPKPTPQPTPVEPEPVVPTPTPQPTPVEPEPVVPTPTPEPQPTPVEPEPVVPTPTPEPEPQPTPVEPKPVAPVIKPVEQVIAGIQQQPSNVFTPNSQAGLDSANPRITTPTPSGSATPNTATPTTATSGLLQQSGNLELVETNEADVNAMVGSGASNSALLPVFVLQGGINLGDLNNNEQ